MGSSPDPALDRGVLLVIQGAQLKLRIIVFFRYFDRKDNFIAHRLVGKIAGRTV
jgi:hypothetical protein